MNLGNLYIVTTEDDKLVIASTPITGEKPKYIAIKENPAFLNRTRLDKQSQATNIHRTPHEAVLAFRERQQSAIAIHRAGIAEAERRLEESKQL